MQNNQCSNPKYGEAMMIGRKLVTYIQTKERKMVLPTAIFLSIPKGLRGSLGAEYKKVSNTAPDSQNQCEANFQANQAAPNKPAM
jgi:hypothetical protein